MKVLPVLTGNLKLDGGAMFGVVPKVMWSKLYPCDENNLCNWAMRCLLVVDGDRRILIDCGIGDKQSEKFFSNYYLNGDDTLDSSLGKCGFTTADITDVILTHLHFDHAGGAIRWNHDRNGYEPAFPNAMYHVGRRQWEWGTRPNNREKASFLMENILPIKELGRLHLLDDDGGDLFPNVSYRLFDGHTDGQVIPFIRYKGRIIVYMADLLPSVAHIPLPWVMAYDTRPLITLKEKEAFMNEAAENEYILFFEHDIRYDCCTVEKGEKGVRLKKAYEWLEEAMEETLDPKAMAVELGIDPEKTDFQLDEKELEKVAGGASASCGEIGYGGKECTSAGVNAGCSEIGAIWESNCTKNGL